MDRGNTQPVTNMFAAEAALPERHTINLPDGEYIGYRCLFSPLVRGNSVWFSSRVPKLCSGTSFLEIGCAVGVLPVRMARSGFRVVATDIDERGVACCRENAAMYGVGLDVRLGNALEPLKDGELFETIFWNHPWCNSEQPVQPPLSASYDHHYQGLESLFAGAAPYLTKGGQLLLGTGSLADEQVIAVLAQKYGWKRELLLSEYQPLQVGGSEFCEFRIERYTKK